MRSFTRNAIRTAAASIVASGVLLTASALDASAGTDDDSLLTARFGIEAMAWELDAKTGTDDDSLLKIRLLLVEVNPRGFDPRSLS